MRSDRNDLRCGDSNSRVLVKLVLAVPELDNIFIELTARLLFDLIVGPSFIRAVRALEQGKALLGVAFFVSANIWQPPYQFHLAPTIGARGDGSLHAYASFLKFFSYLSIIAHFTAKVNVYLLPKPL